MQKTLTFTLDKKKYVSKPFDFETVRLINENHVDENKKGILTCAIDGVYHMFEGTEATNDIIAKIDPADMVKMCNQVWSWYIEVIAKNE